MWIFLRCISGETAVESANWLHGNSLQFLADGNLLPGTGR
jgi:hypothetical protein